MMQGCIIDPIRIPCYADDMKQNTMHYSFLDKLIIQFDQGVRTLCDNTSESLRKNPGDSSDEGVLSKTQRKHSAGLMRVNHAGEVSAQALYQGQALTARNRETKEKMQRAALEEVDHLAWCSQRLGELNSHASYLNPLWYAGSFAIGVGAGIAGDQWSLGFVAETEHQVVRHLDEHLTSISPDDYKSRAIIEQMREDEGHHATVALEAGAAKLPMPIQQGMKVISKVMTTLAYWV